MIKRMSGSPESGWLNDWEDKKDGDAEEREHADAAEAPGMSGAEGSQTASPAEDPQMDLFPHEKQDYSD